jgi:hypothetical protein
MTIPVRKRMRRIRLKARVTSAVPRAIDRADRASRLGPRKRKRLEASGSRTVISSRVAIADSSTPVAPGGPDQSTRIR